MDATVNDFLNEINEIVPPKEKKPECPWKECFDEKSGFPYYWNVESDEVTWEVPAQYKQWKEKGNSNKKSSLYIPPKSSTSFANVSLPIRTESIKIYKIEDLKPQVSTAEIKDDAQNKSVVRNGGPKYVKKNLKKPKTSSDSEEEKIVLISSYGDDSDSEEELENGDTKSALTSIPVNKPASESPKSATQIHSASSDSENDDIDILTKIQHRASQLKKLGGEVPKNVAKTLAENSANKSQKEISGFMLVAGYGSDEEEDDLKHPTETKQTEETHVQAHSTLFPISRPIDVAQFSEPAKVETQKTSFEEASIDTKAFQRKRRIGIDLVNTGVRQKEDSTGQLNVERQGFGYKSTAEYPGFKSGGVMFVKSNDVVNPVKNNVDGVEDLSRKEDASKKLETLKNIDEIRGTLTEKLSFLVEGHAQVSPVQVMMIQIETLYSAMKDGSLESSYFEKWLKDTSSELVKLEKEAAPNGWLLQWDRFNKRYYYRNKATGDCQWDYPQPDVTRCDEAMDISTTPPPPPTSDDEQPIVETKMSPKRTSPPPPPKIGSLVPPPPPIISSKKRKRQRGAKDDGPPLPPAEELPPLPPLPQNPINPGEPLPPGVDVRDIAYNPLPKKETSESSVKDTSESSAKDTLNFALNSFYSDLASITTDEVAPPPPVITPAVPEQIVVDSVKKKKKTKVKLAQGLAMKKKGVSKLVEKWKNIQNSMN